MQKIFLLLTLLLAGCLGNQENLLIQPIESPEASIPFPAGTINLGTSHINENPLTELLVTLTFQGGFRAENISGTTTGVFSFKGGTYPGTGGDCTPTQTFGSCTVMLIYQPLTLGTHNGTMKLNYYTGVRNSVRTFALTGTTVNNISISNAGFAFGNRVIGTTTYQNFTVTNNGTVAMTGIVASGLTGPLTYRGGAYPGTTGTCAGTLAAGASCVIAVEYSPVVIGATTDSIILNYSNGINAETVTRAITGTGVNPALLTISNGATYAYGNRVLTSSNDFTFTVTNSGDVPATAVTGSGLAAPFTFLGGTYPGTGGTCGTTIAVGTCTIVVNYTPTTAAAHADTIQIDYHDGLTTQSTTRALSGTGITVAVLSISDGATYSYGSQVLTTATDKTFTLTNAGQASATAVLETGLAAPFAYKGGSFPGTGGTCTTTIATGTCTVVITYSPTTAATHNDTINFSYNDGLVAQAATRDVTGTGLTPATLTISDGTTYSFGSNLIGTSTDKTFTITYAGDVSATGITGSGLAAPYTFKGGAYPGTGGSCTGTLAAGTCTVVVTYTPTTSATHNDTMDINFNNGATATVSSRAITGVGLTPAILTISDGATYNYGPKVMGTSTDKTFTVTNSGQVSATAVLGSGLASPFSFKGGAYPGTGGSCTGTIAVGTCTIIVSYDPSSAAVHTDTINLDYNDGVSAQLATRALSGTGQNPASLLISDGAAYDYGTKVLTTATDKTFTITNSGDVSATAVVGSGLVAPFLFKGGSYPGSGGTCGTTIGVGTCTIVVTYTPTTAAVHSDTIQIDYNDGFTTQVATRAVTGTGITAAVLSISDGATYAFGNKVLGISTDKTLTITNAGSASATAVVGGGLAAPFTYKGGSYPGTGGTCGGTIATGSCLIVVNYTPTVAGSHSDTVDISYNSGTGGTVANRALSGVGQNPAFLTISDGATYNFGAHSVPTVQSKTFTVTNSGDVSATVVVGSGATSPFDFEGGGGFPGTTGTCTGTIAVGTCTFVVTYSPTVIAVDNATINLAYNDGFAAQNATRPVTGEGTAKKRKDFADRVVPMPIFVFSWKDLLLPYQRESQHVFTQKVQLKDHLSGLEYAVSVRQESKRQLVVVTEILSEKVLYALPVPLHLKVEIKKAPDQNNDQMEDFALGLFAQGADSFILEKILGIDLFEGKILFAWPERDY